ncbi:MAG: hypothetical protein ACPGYX_07580, partial [Oceanobacter sp.]
GFELVRKNASVEQSSRSSLMLSNVTFKKIDGLYCASIKGADLKALVGEYLHLSQSYQTRDLAGSHKQRRLTALKWQANLEQVQLLLLVFPELANSDTRYRINKQQQEIAEALGQLFPQTVTFQLPLENASLTIAGKQESIGEPIPLNEGRYLYDIRAPGLCPMTGDFDLSADEEKIIDLDPDDYRFPTIRISTNHPDKVSVMLEGTELTPGEELILRKCQGTIQARLNFRDGAINEVEQFSFSVKPGKSINEHYTFRTEAERKKLNRLAGSFNQGSRLELKYALGGLPDDYKEFNGDQEFHRMHQIYLAWMQTRSWYRHGPGVMFARGVEQHHSADLYYQLGLQLGDLGNGMPLHIGRYIALVPFIDFQFGFGYHQYVAEDSDDVVNKYQIDEEQEEDDFARDYLVARVGGGVDITFTSALSIQLFAHQALTQEENFTAGAGLTFKLQ